MPPRSQAKEVRTINIGKEQEAIVAEPLEDPFVKESDQPSEPEKVEEEVLQEAYAPVINSPEDVPAY